MMTSRGAVLEARTGGAGHTAHSLVFAAVNNKPGVCLPLIAKRAYLRVKTSLSNQSSLSHYGFSAYPPPCPLGQGAARGEARGRFPRWLPPFAVAAWKESQHTTQNTTQRDLGALVTLAEWCKRGQRLNKDE
jgi:hypothetical protein